MACLIEGLVFVILGRVGTSVKEAKVSLQHFKVQVLKKLLKVQSLALQLNEKLLSVRACLSRRARVYVLLYLLPLFPVQLKRFQEAIVLELGPTALVVIFRVGGGAFVVLFPLALSARESDVVIVRRELCRGCLRTALRGRDFEPLGARTGGGRPTHQSSSFAGTLFFIIHYKHHHLYLNIKILLICTF